MNDLDELGKNLVTRIECSSFHDRNYARSRADKLGRCIMWALIIFGLTLTALCLICAAPAHATTWFNPVPNTLTNSGVLAGCPNSPASSVGTGCSGQVNADYAKIVTDGNAANTNLLAQIAALGSGGLPTGAVVAVNGVCPTGFTPSDGTRQTADTRGLFIRGLDNQAGRDPNRILASYQADQIQNHFHVGSSFAGSAAFGVNVSLGFGASSLLSANPTVTEQTSTMTSPVGRVETSPASVVLQYCSPVPTVTPGGVTPFSPPPQILSNLVVPDANIMMADYNQIISDGNVAFNAIQAAITAVGAITPMPAAAVVPFNLAVCPAGWVASDGTGGTVDMRARFARITTGSPAVGTFQADQFLNHTHTVPGTFVTGTFGTGATAGGAIAGIIFSLNSSVILDAINARIGTETRPQNVALLYCQKS